MAFSMTKSDFISRLAEGFAANGLSALLTSDAEERFYLLTDELLRCASFMNLTAITDPCGIIVRHYADCAAAVPLIPPDVHAADIGTGAGFPALPFAILRRDITVTAVDATKKKLDYVKNTAALLGLTNLTVHAARAEALGQDPLYREQFDFVSARAVARMNVLTEWCLPLVKKGGLFLAMKGRDGHAEAEEAAHAVETLGGVPEKTVDFSLSDPFSPQEEDMRRCLLLIRKRQFTPKQYPRANAQIAKKPL